MPGNRRALQHSWIISDERVRSSKQLEESTCAKNIIAGRVAAQKMRRSRGFV
jgi:hypothetical protein